MNYKKFLIAKEDWIFEYIDKNEIFKVGDILDENFIDAFIKQFTLPSEDITVGVPDSRELSELLNSMFKRGLIKRSYFHGAIDRVFDNGSFAKFIFFIFSIALLLYAFLGSNLNFLQSFFLMLVAFSIWAIISKP